MAGCLNLVEALAYCNAHYLRHRKHGDPLGGLPAPRAARALDHNDETRTCLGCGERKALTSFPKDKNASKGRRADCKPCHSVKSSAWYAANKAEHLPRAQARYKRDIDKVRERDRERYYRDREKRIELVVESYHRRRCALAARPADRGINYAALRVRDGDLCCYCKRQMTFDVGRKYRPDRGTIEHVLPVSQGGTHTWDNVALACQECNIRKNARTVDEWEPSRGGGQPLPGH